MKNIFNNKIIPILLITMIVIFSSVSNVFAGEITINETTYNTNSYLDNYYYFIITFNNGQSYSIYFSSKPLSFDKFTSNDNDNYIRGAVDTEIYMTSISNLTELSYIDTYTLNRTNEPFRPSGNYTFIYSSFDIYDSQENLVFHVAPQAPEVTRVLVEQATQAEMKETLLGTIKTFLVYLVIFVISLLAIFKAVRFLRNVLKTS